VTQLHPDAETIFKDSYLVDFPGLPEAHSEQELLPVGGQDFRLDPLFYFGDSATRVCSVTQFTSQVRPPSSE
jgi:hypothetical protein